MAETERPEQTTSTKKNDESPKAGDFENWHKMFDEELRMLGVEKGDPLSGICLSGGGVRSAVTAMGILSCLSKRNVLPHMHYMSTVSGGGYAGAALTAWRHVRSGSNLERPGISGRSDAPFSVPSEKERGCENEDHGNKAKLEQNAAYVRHLRANVSYLMPDGLRGIMRGVFIFVRALVPNLFVWITFLTAIFYGLLYVGRPDQANAGDGIDVMGSFTKFLEQIGAATVPSEWGSLTVFTAAAGTAIGFLALVIVGMFFYAFWTWLGSCLYQSKLVLKLYRSKVVLKLIEKKWVRKPEIAKKRYIYRRLTESRSAALFLIALFLGLFAAIPFVSSQLGELLAALSGAETTSEPAKPKVEVTADVDEATPADGISFVLGTLSTLFGIASALFALAREKLGKVIGAKTVIFLVFGCVLFVTGVLLLSFNLALVVHLDGITDKAALLTLAAAVFVALACHGNEQSLGRFYRDRLMEAFIPNTDDIVDDTRLAEIGKAATQANELTFGKIAAVANDKKNLNRPLHLVNCNVMAWWSKDTRTRRRRGDNFVLSAVGGGSDMTHWRTVEGIADGKITLATAVAASGAAANPAGGFAGTGPTTLFPVAVAMSLLNIRLGYWLRWRNGCLHSFNPFGNRINPPLFHFLGRIIMQSVQHFRKPAGYAPNFIELTDGGHFENLGLYELVRRRCKLIIICDAGADPAASYASFTSSIRRIREDFQTDIRFDMQRDQFPEDPRRNDFTESGPQDVVPRDVKDQYPSDTQYAEKGYFLASAHYPKHTAPTFEEGQDRPDGYRAQANGETLDRGLIIYLKTALIDNVDHTTKGYRGVNKKFPYDPTSNQFFTPEQFEAYRDVGEKIALQMVKDLKLEKILNSKVGLDIDHWPKSDFFWPDNQAELGKGAGV